MREKKEYRCVEKYRMPNGAVAWFKLQNTKDLGQFMIVSKFVLKLALQHNVYRVTNLILTKNNRIREKKESICEVLGTEDDFCFDSSINPYAELERKIARASLCHRVKKLSTECSHYCYLLDESPNNEDKKYTLYIPKNVVSITGNVETKLVSPENINIVFQPKTMQNAGQKEISVSETLARLVNAKMKVVGGDNVRNYSYLFRLTNFKELDLSQMKTDNATNMCAMFKNSYTKILKLGSFNVSKVKFMDEMFMQCFACELDLSSFTVNGASIEDIFYGNDIYKIILKQGQDDKLTRHIKMIAPQDDIALEYRL